MSQVVEAKSQMAVVAASQTTPMALMEKAINSNVSPESLEKLMALQERFEANEARKQFHAAMHDFQAIKPALKRSSKVKFSTSKGTTEYNFCALPDIEAALREPLSRVGLSYRFQNFSEGQNIGVTCVVSHVSGHSEQTSMAAPIDNSGNKNGIQGIGSTTTYLQRYTLISAFGLTTADDDDDGGGNGDMPYLILMKHNAFVRDNYVSIYALKEALREQDYELAAEVWAGWSREQLGLLWIAPTKGGLLTTKEREQIKSSPFSEAHSDYLRKHPRQDNEQQGEQ